jgi:hypothetical protein
VLYRKYAHTLFILLLVVIGRLYCCGAGTCEPELAQVPKVPAACCALCLRSLGVLPIKAQDGGMAA